MKVLKIVSGTSVDGPGLRTSVYFAGCTHHCPGCHNPQSWDFAAGEEISVEALLATLLEDEAPVTLSGGDPLQQPTAELLTLLQGLKTAGVNVWCYTGYTFEQLLQSDTAGIYRRGGRRRVCDSTTRHLAPLPRERQPAHH